MNEPAGSDKRSARRVSYLCEVECSGAGTSRMNARINDLSVTGLFLDSMTPIPEGSDLNLRFEIRGKQISVRGQVRYCMPQIGVGVRFLDLSSEAQALIEQLLSDSSEPA